MVDSLLRAVEHLEVVAGSLQEVDSLAEHHGCLAVVVGVVLELAAYRWLGFALLKS